jgi:outer membrane protein TolC
MSARSSLLIQLSLLFTAAALAPPALARCVDEDRPLAAEAGADVPSPPVDPRTTLQTLVREALERSNAVGASHLLAEAALADVEETRSGKLPQVALSLGAGPSGLRQNGDSQDSKMQARTSLTVSQLLYDGGRTDRMTDWRTQLAESARLGNLSAREQIALQTVSLALERSRYRQHVIVYGQYVRKMACLVEALETIVRADRGRASELVQARKSLQQAELSQTQAQSQARQTDVRLRRLVGDGLPAVEGLATALLEVPDLPQLVADVEQSAEIGQLTAQAAAADQYARAAAAGGKPQLSWSFTGGASSSAASDSTLTGTTPGKTSGTNYALGVSLNIPLYTPGLAPASSAARKRAEAAALQRADAIESRRFRVAEVHEQTLSSFDRARRVGAVLRDSDLLRDYTLQQWQQLGKRSLFDVMGTESEHYNLRVQYVNALHDGQQLNANLLSLGRGVNEWLR